MNKKLYIIALFSVFNLTGTGYAANPATKEYVDAQVAILQSQIAAIPAWKQGPAGPGVTTYTVGQPAMGGIVFWVDVTGQHGLIAARVNNSDGVTWLNTNFLLTGTGNSDGIFAGIKNNSQIMAIQIPDGANNFAAKVCADYQIQANGTTACVNPGTAGATCYADWYLPSKFELNQLFLQKETVGGFDNSGYWSSTENLPSGAVGFAWLQDFSNGLQGGISKDANFIKVRCVRAF